MTSGERNLLFGLFAKVARGLGPAAREIEREKLTVEVFGRARSWSTFTHGDVDRMKAALETRRREHDLAPRIEAGAYRTHDAAQAAHVPVVRLGKRERAKSFPRHHASRYEQQTPVDDPGARRRLVFWIGRLFEPAYIRSLVVDLDDTADWESLPIPQLLALKETLKNRLGKWLTRHKEHYAFGFNIASRNPRSTTEAAEGNRGGRKGGRAGLLTNDELIGELLSRGLRVDMREETARAEDEPSLEVEAPF